MKLLKQFVLQQIQVSRLNAELMRVERESAEREARIELNLTPRVVDGQPDTDLPAYQVSAQLECKGGEKDSEPAFVVSVCLEAIYQQVNGDPIDLAYFTQHHPSLTRQLYPVLQTELRQLLLKLGLEQIKLPYDLMQRQDVMRISEPQINQQIH